jgi:UDP-N-acetylmuramoylalanine--D-glutamate ligase
MQVAIVGYGVDGVSAFQYWSGLGASVTICDQDTSKVLPDTAAHQLGDDYLQNLGRFDVIVRSSGIHPDTITRENPGVEGKITTIVNEFLRVCPTKNVIGVTGTKGKGTTSTLITRMLEAAGKDVQLGGNIGIPILDFLPELTPESWVVLELSSFQLSDVRYSPHIGVCLMMAPEHLNWHADMDDYLSAKSHLFSHQTEQDKAIYFADNDNSKKIASASPGQKIPYFAPPGASVQDTTITIDDISVCDISELKLLGEHNWQNVCAAVTAIWQVTQDVEAIRSVLTSFSGLEHRLEFVREASGVSYYNDSFGTTPETATVALEAFKQPKVIILGGSDKGASYDALASAVASSNVRAAILIGDQAARIRAALAAAGFTSVRDGGASMSEIVATASASAQSGDVVLLSPACASFGMFENYKDRGHQFKQAVNELA